MFSRRAFCTSARRCSQRSSEEIEAYKRKRQAEWKRRQGGAAFLDHLIVTVRGGKGGDGCAAFHREKFKPFGPPSGGNGGKGGPVHFLPTPTLTTLSTVPSRIRGHNGEHGKGTWQNGKAGEPLIIKVPLGTVVRELGRNDPRRAKDEWESEEEAMIAEGLTTGERVERMREKRWIHYPGYGESNIIRDDFREAEAAMYKMERERRLARRRRMDQNPIFLDLDKPEGPDTSSTEADNAPLGIRQSEYLGHLIAQGGQGGQGNPHFVSMNNRTPRFATRGHEGERVTLFLELKLLADIGLVGMPNAGKSTLLRALTGGRAKTDVAGYAFTTLNPVVGIVRTAEDGTFEGELVPEETVYDETKIEEQEYEEKMKRGEFANSLTRNQLRDSSSSASPSSSSTLTSKSPNIDAHAESRPTRPGHHFDLYETFRFTIADNPGLIENSASPFAHAGLGHSFLRAIERSPALVCVVDFSSGQQQPSSFLPSPPTSESSSTLQASTTTEDSTSTPNPPSATPGPSVVDSSAESTEFTSSSSDDIIPSPPPIAEESTTTTSTTTTKIDAKPNIDPITINVDPCEAIKILKSELETYQEGMSSRIKMVIANKADLVAGPSSASSGTITPSEESIQEAKARLTNLEQFAKKELGPDVVVVPVSAKYRMNLRKVVALMKGYAEDAREEKLATARRAAEAEEAW